MTETTARLQLVADVEVEPTLSDVQEKQLVTQVASCAIRIFVPFTSPQQSPEQQPVAK